MHSNAQNLRSASVPDMSVSVQPCQIASQAGSGHRASPIIVATRAHV